MPLLPRRPHAHLPGPSARSFACSATGNNGCATAGQHGVPTQHRSHANKRGSKLGAFFPPEGAEHFFRPPRERGQNLRSPEHLSPISSAVASAKAEALAKGEALGCAWCIRPREVQARGTGDCQPGITSTSRPARAGLRRAGQVRAPVLLSAPSCGPSIWRREARGEKRQTALHIHSPYDKPRSAEVAVGRRRCLSPAPAGGCLRPPPGCSPAPSPRRL